MDTSRKEAVQRGIVHLQQRFWFCTENGNVTSILSMVSSICSILFHSVFPSSAKTGLLQVHSQQWGIPFGVPMHASAAPVTKQINQNLLLLLLYVKVFTAGIQVRTFHVWGKYSALLSFSVLWQFLKKYLGQ